MKVFALHLQHSVLCSLTDKCVSERQVSNKLFFSIPSIHKITIYLFGKWGFDSRLSSMCWLKESNPAFLQEPRGAELCFSCCYYLCVVTCQEHEWHAKLHEIQTSPSYREENRETWRIRLHLSFSPSQLDSINVHKRMYDTEISAHAFVIVLPPSLQ